MMTTNGESVRRCQSSSAAVSIYSLLNIYELIILILINKNKQKIGQVFYLYNPNVAYEMDVSAESLPLISALILWPIPLLLRGIIKKASE